MTAPMASREELLARLDAAANHQGYPEAFGGSWTKLARDAAAALRAGAAQAAPEDLVRKGQDFVDQVGDVIDRLGQGQAYSSTLAAMNAFKGMTRAVTFTQAQVRRAVKAAESVGMKVTRITVNPNGSITVGGENPQVLVDTRKATLAASWDDV